jgi:hypothetical protein
MALITNRSYVDKNVMLYGRNTYDTTTTPSNQVKIVASDGATGDNFGISVAVGSGRIVVGATADDDLGTDSGSAYIFNLFGTQLAKIKASDGAASDFFGDDVSIGSGRIVVGSPGDDDLGTDSGSAYIFNLFGTQLAKIKASDGAVDNYFGDSVAVGSGRIVVGATGSPFLPAIPGYAYIFDLSGNQLAKILASDGATGDNFGISVAIGCGRIVVGASGDDDSGSNSGSAYILDLNGNQLAKIKASDGAASDNFGSSVAIGSGRIVVGASGDDDLGSNSGSAYIFDLNGTQLAKIKASDGAANDNFGNHVAIGSGRIVVCSTFDDDPINSGSAYIFDLNGNQLTKIVASDGATSDLFGSSVAIGSGRIVIGALSGDGSGSDFGAAYIYTTPDQPHILDILDNN